MSVSLSIIMSVKDNIDTLPLAVKSVLNQDFTDYEFLIVDDGSSDGSSVFLNEINDDRVRIHRNDISIGLASSLNFLLTKVEGKYIARMDGDDVSLQGRFRSQVEYLENNISVDLLAGKAIVIDEKNKVQGALPCIQDHVNITSKPWSSFPMPHPTWMAKAAWLKKYKYKESSRRSEDQELLARAYANSQFQALSRPLLAYRKTGWNASKELSSRVSLLSDLLSAYIGTGSYLLVIKTFVVQIAKTFVFSLLAYLFRSEKVLSHRYAHVSSIEVDAVELELEQLMMESS